VLDFHLYHPFLIMKSSLSLTPMLSLWISHWTHCNRVVAFLIFVWILNNQLQDCCSCYSHDKLHLDHSQIRKMPLSYLHSISWLFLLNIPFTILEESLRQCKFILSLFQMSDSLLYPQVKPLNVSHLLNLEKLRIW